MTNAECVYARLSPICGLCQQPFWAGDAFKAIYQRPVAPSPFTGRAGVGLALSITVHQRCFGQLGPGDLTLVFDCLGRGLRLPLAELHRLRLVGLL